MGQHYADGEALAPALGVGAVVPGPALVEAVVVGDFELALGEPPNVSVLPAVVDGHVALVAGVSKAELDLASDSDSAEPVAAPDLLSVRVVEPAPELPASSRTRVMPGNRLSQSRKLSVSGQILAQRPVCRSSKATPLKSTS